MASDLSKLLNGSSNPGSTGAPGTSGAGQFSNELAGDESGNTSTGMPGSASGPRGSDSAGSVSATSAGYGGESDGTKTGGTSTTYGLGELPVGTTDDKTGMGAGTTSHNHYSKGN